MGLCVELDLHRETASTKPPLNYTISHTFSSFAYSETAPKGMATPGYLSDTDLT
jgi:hypothetical protein